MGLGGGAATGAGTVGGSRNDRRMEQRDGGPVMVTRTVQAWQLQPGWIVIPDQGSPRRVASNQLQGATPAAVVEFVGVDHRITYPATQAFTIEDNQ